MGMLMRPCADLFIPIEPKDKPLHIRTYLESVLFPVPLVNLLMRTNVGLKNAS